MRRLLPVLLALLGLAAGGGAGYVLRPAVETPAGDPAAAEHAGLGEPAAAVTGEAAGDGGHEASEFVKLNNQFVVPIVEKGDVTALVILSISIEMAAGGGEEVFAREPKIRDRFLQVLFDHANAGGFDGVFTRTSNLDGLRKALLEVAEGTLGPACRDVLITDIVRQDS